MTAEQDLFDPDGPGSQGLLFGMEVPASEALVHVSAFPFDATASGRRGTASGPDAILAASAAVDLFDLSFGAAWTAGLAWLGADPRVPALQLEATRLVDAVRAGSGTAATRARIDAIGAEIASLSATTVEEALAAGRIPALVGGDHSVSLGGMRAACKWHQEPVGVLHVDAHADLRDAYEGFRYSHASVFHELMSGPFAPETLVQVGIRDVGAREWARAEGDRRIHSWPDHELATRAASGESIADIFDTLLEPLPHRVWISCDIDGLDPSLCPGTGTPVPGGLTWREVVLLLVALVDSGRQVIGFDLVEVAPAWWDASVGARLLYKLCGAAVRTCSVAHDPARRRST